MTLHVTRRKTSLLAPLAALVVFLVIWETMIRLFSISPIILPGPFAVAAALVAHSAYLLRNAGITFVESVLGFILGGGLAVFLGVLFIFSPKLEKALFPYAIAIKSIPLVALAPIVVVWFSTGVLSKVVMAAIISFFPILVNLTQGLKSVEPEALDLMAIFSASKWQVLTKLQFPQALPYLFAGMKVSATFAVVGAVVAEFVGAQSGVGYVVKSSSYYLDTDLTFAAVIVSALTGLALFLLVAQLEKRVVFWHSSRRIEADLK